VSGVPPSTPTQTLFASSHVAGAVHGGLQFVQTALASSQTCGAVHAGEQADGVMHWQVAPSSQTCGVVHGVVQHVGVWQLHML